MCEEKTLVRCVLKCQCRFFLLRNIYAVFDDFSLSFSISDALCGQGWLGEAEKLAEGYAKGWQP